MRKIKETGVVGMICVNMGAGVVEDRHVGLEKIDNGLRSVGSAFQSVGAVTAERVMRKPKLARGFRELEGLLRDSVSEILDSLDRGEEILVEGA